MDIWIPKREKHPLEDDYSDVEVLRHPDGLIFVDGKEVGNTLQCPHCGGHFTPRKGEPRKRCLIHDKKVCDEKFCNTFCVDYYSTIDMSSTREL